MKQEPTAVITYKWQGGWLLIYWHTPGGSSAHTHRHLTCTCDLEVLVLCNAQGDPKASPIKPHRHHPSNPDVCHFPVQSHYRFALLPQSQLKSSPTYQQVLNREPRLPSFCLSGCWDVSLNLASWNPIISRPQNGLWKRLASLEACNHTFFGVPDYEIGDNYQRLNPCSYTVLRLSCQCQPQETTHDLYSWPFEQGSNTGFHR